MHTFAVYKALGASFYRVVTCYIPPLEVIILLANSDLNLVQLMPIPSKPGFERSVLCHCIPRHTVQLFSQNSLTATVPEVLPIGLCGVVEANLEPFCNSWSAGVSGEGLYSGKRRAESVTVVLEHTQQRLPQVLKPQTEYATFAYMEDAPHFSHPREPSAVLELSKTGATWSRDGCKKMGKACLATSTPKCSEIGQISKQSRGQGGSDEKAAIRTRMGRNFPIVCVHFCHLSQYTEIQSHTSKRKRHELTGTGRPAGTTQKNLTSGRHVAHW